MRESWETSELQAARLCDTTHKTCFHLLIIYTYTHAQREKGEERKREGGRDQERGLNRKDVRTENPN